MHLIGIVHLLIAITFALHAHRTGRPEIWLYILLFVPLVGSVAYVLIEVLPELAGSRRARKVASDIHTVVDPDGEFRRRAIAAAETDTVQAKCLLAEECERKGMWAEAIAMYERAAQGLFADDPDLLRGLARAQVGAGDAGAALSTLDRLRRAHPAYQNQDGHLSYARAMELQGRLDAAEREYRALSGYFVGLEARARHAMLLQRLGEEGAARRIYEQIVKAAKARGVVLSEADREWLRLAQRNL